jgi:PAS domain S-box-containing protein
MAKILVVEDSRVIREEICEILQFENFEVIWAENGIQGLEQAKKELPNLIISDILMPKLNGYQLLAELQKSSTTESIPFIFLSAKSELLDLRKGMNMGADDYLVKPFNTDELIKIVKSKLKKQQLIQDNIDKLAKENEDLLKETSKIGKIGHWEYTNEAVTVFWSDVIHEIYGSDVKAGLLEIEIILSVFTKESRKKLVEATLILANEGTPFDIELEMTNFKNEKRWIRDIGEPIFDDKNEIVGRKGISQDITSLKKAINKIKKGDEMYRLLTDNSNDIICLQEPDSTFKYISPSIKNILGYEQSEFLGKKVFSIVHPDDIQSFQNAMKKKLFKGLSIGAYPFRIRHKDGHFVWLEFLTSPVYKEGEISYFVTSARDITQWIIAKQEIQKYQTSLQKLTTEITLIEEKQKKEIATNIHDHLSQSLIISKMKINELKKKPQLKMIDKDLQFIETHISEALENSRKITYELSPPVLYQLGIVAALNWLLEDVEATHKIECRVSSNINYIKLSEIKSILLYRCIQELLKNALKYANASLLILKIDKTKLGIEIVLTDNGVGFDTSILNNYKSHSNSGFGLFAVQERVRNLQGEFKITSKIHEGTTVNILIPLIE